MQGNGRSSQRPGGASDISRDNDIRWLLCTPSTSILGRAKGEGGAIRGGDQGGLLGSEERSQV